MSPVDPQHYTPLDINGLRKKTMFASVPNAPKIKSQSRPSGPVPNLMLIGSVITLVLSLGYSIQTTRLSSNSRASAPGETKVAYFAQKNVLSTVLNVPKGYAGEEIPPALITDIEAKYGSLSDPNKKKYVIDKIVRYYVYRDVLKENALPYETTVPSNLDQVAEQVTNMERSLKENLLSKAYFAYVRAQFDNLTEEKTAKSSIEKYKKSFTESENFTDVINQSNTDPTLMKLNNNVKNEILKDYMGTENKFIDPEFNTFLFEQKDRMTSEIYTLKDDKNKHLGYIVVYPLGITKQKYSDLNQIITERIGKFN